MGKILKGKNGKGVFLSLLTSSIFYKFNLLNIRPTTPLRWITRTLLLLRYYEFHWNFSIRQTLTLTPPCTVHSKAFLTETFVRSGWVDTFPISANIGILFAFVNVCWKIKQDANRKEYFYCVLLEAKKSEFLAYRNIECQSTESLCDSNTLRPLCSHIWCIIVHIF